MAELYVRAQLIVERGYRQPLTLPNVARALAVSPRQLERAYDEIGLTTFAAHRRAVRLRNAAELLARQPLTVSEVARLVGYRQPSNFVKAFRRRFGVTPGTFRDRARRAPSPPDRHAGGLPRTSAPPVRYSKPNSEAARLRAAGDGAGTEDFAAVGPVSAVAARATSGARAARGEAEPVASPAPSKPNSPLA